VVWTASYLPFGGVHVTSGAPVEARFPGQWFQAESGLHQNWMRDYDPTTGRYLEPDPLGLVDGASVYGYARQNPMRWTDPRGECPWCVVVVGAVIGGVVGYNETGCWQGAAVGAAVGALGGMAFNGLAYLGAGGMGSGLASGGAAAAASQILVNEIQGICGCEGDEVPVSDLISSQNFWLNNAMGGFGGAMGGFAAGGTSSGLAQWAGRNTGRQFVSEFAGGMVGYGTSNPINTVQDIIPGGN